MHNTTAGPTFDVALMMADMTLKGWRRVDLARRAGVSHMTVSRFFDGDHRTAPVAKKLARALGRKLDRYLTSAA